MRHISKCEFSQPGGTGDNITQKRKLVLIESWSPSFFFFFFVLVLILVQNLNYTAKLPDWSIIDYLLPWQPLKIRLHDSMPNVDMYLPSKYVHNSTYGNWVRMTPVLFSQSEALYGYHGNQMKIIHWFWKSVTRATIWYNTYLKRFRKVV